MARYKPACILAPACIIVSVMTKPLQTTFLKIDSTSIFSSYLPAKGPREDGLTLVLLHGAGQSSSQRYTAFSHLFTEAGIAVVALDFIGHGQTTGETHTNSLALPTKHALAAIQHWARPGTPLILCGSSMGAHTALRVASTLRSQVKSLCLLQPALYAAEAEDLYFNAAFTAVLRRENSWQTSLALQDASQFTGKALVAIGKEDTVIPWGVIERLTQRLKQQASGVQLQIFGGVGHQLPTWIPEQPLISRQLVEYLSDTNA